MMDDTTGQWERRSRAKRIERHDSSFPSSLSARILGSPEHHPNRAVQTKVTFWVSSIDQAAAGRPCD